jgi:TPR repeat protein
LRLGRLYELGNGLPKDFQQASHWYQQAAERGNTFAQYSLGRVKLFLGDDKEAYYWFKQAAEAEKDNCFSSLALSIMYYAGQAAPKNDEQALYWYKKAEMVWHDRLLETIKNDKRSELNSYLYVWPQK